MAWTEEQQQAISLEGTNIIVSAGAGSGKTAVLTERVKRKILEGVHVNQLLVLTFTNAAAKEMKDRIRDAIMKTPGLEKELDLIDGAYITTFDAFSLAILKKYHTKLNITNKIEVCDEILVDLIKKEILEEIMNEEYALQNKDFLKVIHDFCLKDDKELSETLLTAYKKIELKVDKSEFLKNYFIIFNEEKVKSFLEEYHSLLVEKQKEIQEKIIQLNDYFDGDFVGKIEDNFHKLLEATTYDEFVSSMEYESIRVPRGCSEEGKNLKGEIFDLVKELKEKYLIYDSEEELKEDYLSTIEAIQVFIRILKRLDNRLDTYKREHSLFTFNDISRLAIEVVSNNPDIKEELKNQFQEIMVDEYQDTNDTQEAFISLISHNNVYMVGDIKQSIYRFRNANPSIFKNKYDTYRDTSLGEKIDLLKNFRSRREVLEDINLLFDFIMDDKLGGAEYQESHRMVFGNKDYEELGSTKDNHHMEFYTYNSKELGKIRNNEEEAFIIANDIKEKIKAKTLIFDKNKKELRECTYKDFVILLDKSRDFELYKKIFEYFGIPLTILKDESFQKDKDSYVFKNLLKFILCIHDKKFDSKFHYLFVSLSRSYLFPMEDSEIYERFVNKRYEDSELYQVCLELSSYLDTMTPSSFIQLIFHRVDYDLKLLTIGNVSSMKTRSEYFYHLAESYEKHGKTIYDFVEYLDLIEDGDYDLSFHINQEIGDSCSIMTIHKSKGLEFPICYFAGFTSQFNFMELNSRILFDNDYGFILPKVEESYKDTFLKTLLKHRVRLEEVAEKIRLFYVATTRAKEKMIFVLPEIEEKNEVNKVIPFSVREKYKSFYHMIESIYSLLNEYSISKDIIVNREYLVRNKEDYIEGDYEGFQVEEIPYNEEFIEEAHFSKENISIITKEDKDKMEFGTKVHEYLEYLDFKNLKEIELIEDKKVQNIIKAFLMSDFMKKYQDSNFYHEYEFIYQDQNESKHGIIDLLIENKEEYIIIDYKLKDIDDLNYMKQLNGYRNYIESITNKKVSCFLYSILDEEFKEVFDEN